MTDFLSSYYDDNDTSWAIQGRYSNQSKDGLSTRESSGSQYQYRRQVTEGRLSSQKVKPLCEQVKTEDSDDSDFCVPVASMSFFETDDQKSMMTLELKTLRKNSRRNRQQSMDKTKKDEKKKNRKQACKVDKEHTIDTKISLRSVIEKWLSLGKKKGCNEEEVKTNEV